MPKIVYRMEIFGEGDWRVAVCPELGISRTGKTADECGDALRDAVFGYLKFCEKDGVLEDVLEGAGFERRGGEWRLAPRAVEKVALTLGEDAADAPSNGGESWRSCAHKSKSGVEIPVARMTEDDMRREMEALESKYGMTSKEFAIKYRAGGFSGHNPDFLDWESYYDAVGLAERNGRGGTS